MGKVFGRYVAIGLAIAMVPQALGRPVPGDTHRELGERMSPAAGVLLVAKRDLRDPHFHRTVVLIIQHGVHGTVGLVLNRRTHLQLHDALPDMPGTQAAEHSLFLGGPVGRTLLSMLIRNEKPAEHIERVTREIGFSADRELLEQLVARRKSVNDLRLYLGHAGWAPGQLQIELARGDWHLARASVTAVFGDEMDLWDDLIETSEPSGLSVHNSTPSPMPLGPVGSRF